MNSFLCYNVDLHRRITMTSYYEKNKEKIKEQRRLRYATDVVYRETQQANSKQWRESNPERMMEHRLTWEHSRPEWRMYHNACRRAKELQIPFDITYKDIHIPEYCPVLGFKLTSDNRETNPSLDRVVPELGYTKGNIQVISMRANRLKQDASIEELKKILAYITDQKTW